MLFEVKSSLAPEEVNDVMLETFKKWMNFLMGVRPNGGQMVSNPSGKLAASYKLKKIDDYKFAIYTPDNSPQSVQDWVLKQGRGSVDLKSKMLGASAHGKVHTGLKPPHYRWRDVPIRQTPPKPSQNLQGMMRRGSLDISSLLGRPNEEGVGLKRKYARMWAKEYQTAYGNEDQFRAVPQQHWKNEPRKQSRFSMKGETGGAVKFRRMSDRPDSSSWILPEKPASEMPAFNAGHILKQVMRGKITSARD